MPRPNIASLSDAVTDYRRQRQGRYSASTWKAHTRVLNTWAEWMYRDTQPGVYLTDIDERHMVRYFDRIRPPACSQATFNNYRQYLCQFWTYCRDEGWVHTNPMREVRPMRVPKRTRRQLGKADLLALLVSSPPRDRAALAIAMNTGLRGGDIMALKISNLDFHNQYLVGVWVEKTDSEVELPMTLDLREELLRWLPLYAASMGTTWTDLPADWFVVPTQRLLPQRGGGRAIRYYPRKSPRHPEKIVARALERSGLGTTMATKGDRFHMLRRSAAREVFDTAVAQGIGDPIRIPQALLGHKNRQTTEIYLGVTHEKQLLDEMLRGKSFLGAAGDEADIIRPEVWKDVSTHAR